MSNIKNTLSILCELLKLTCDSEIDPECFRSAKYDKNDNGTVEKFWILLTSFSDIDYHNILDSTKIFFASKNYRNIEFYSLQNNSNSRELLIAFAWLLSQNENNVLDNKIRKKIFDSKICCEFDDFLSLNSNQDIVINFKSILQYHNLILDWCGKIDLNLKIIEEYNIKIIQYLKQIRKLAPNLSVLELSHLKEHRNFDRYLSEIKSVSDLINLYTKWKSNENYFWKWMLTVIELKNERTTEMILDKHTLKLVMVNINKYFKNYEKNALLKITDTLRNYSYRLCFELESQTNTPASLTDVQNHFESLRSEEMKNLHLIEEFLREIV